VSTLIDTPAPVRAPEPVSRAGGRLAVDGGDPVVPRGIMLSRWPRVSEDDLQAVMQAARAGTLTEMSGRDLVRQFEAEVAMWLGTRYALTTNGGTAALHCALAGLGVQPGDEVVVPSLSYIACAAAVVHQGAIPVFADVDPRTYNVTAASVEARITPRTRALMVVHMHGLPAPMDELLELGRRHGIPVLEDFSQAAGAAWRGRPVGSMGDAGAASLMAGKNLPAAGEGGIVCTSAREVRNRAASLKCFAEAVEADGSYTPLHETMGYNYRINLLSLVFASRQLFRLDGFNDRRREGAARLDAVLGELPGFSPPAAPEGARHVYHMYRFRFDPREAGLSLTADQAREGLKAVFWAEGLPLVEFQNVPLPGHALMQGKVGYGRGAPWSCHGRDDVYRIEDHPGALDAIRHSLVVGYPAQAPLANPRLVEHYAAGFRKVGENLDDFARFAAGLPAEAPPWSQPARIF
jgi:dTDP-4-amino-4,6-dideoxygalactose transaminase